MLPCILVVDDEPVQRTLMKLVLRRADWNVIEAGDGAEAVEAAAGEKLDLVLMDLQLPGMDGYATTAAIRSLGGGNASVPILAFTATYFSDPVTHFRAFGIDGYVGKPCNIVSLIESVEPWRPSGAANPARRLTPLLGADEIDSLLRRFRGQMADAVSAIDEIEGRASRAHRLAGLAGTLGFRVVFEHWLALSEGDDSAIEPARVAARKAMLQIDRELGIEPAH